MRGIIASAPTRTRCGLSLDRVAAAGVAIMVSRAAAVDTASAAKPKAGAKRRRNPRTCSA
jgi:hypothetical protein